MNNKFLEQQHDLHYRASVILSRLRSQSTVLAEAEASGAFAPSSIKHLKNDIQRLQKQYADVMQKLMEPAVDISGILVARCDMVTLAEEFHG